MATHDQVAHAWAHQTGRHRKGFNMFYDGETIYSYGYHFPIAKHVTAPNGERVVLFTTDGHSISTAKHKTIVRRAIGYNRTDVLEVPLRVSQYSYRDIPMEDVRDLLIDKLPDLALKWRRARSNKLWYAATMQETITTINRVNDLWMLGHEPLQMPEDIAEYSAEYERQREEARKEQDRKDREAIRKWVAGEDIRPPHTRIPYVRVKDVRATLGFMGDQGERIDRVVETSWGIKVPLREALPVFRLAKLIQKCGKDWHPKKEHQVGGWRLDRITADGTVRAGCHAIPLRAQLEAAKLAGLA